MTSIPPVLAERGAVFVPIEPGEKRPTVPRTPDNLRAADDAVMRAYLENGHNYGVAMQGDLAALDADDPDALAPIIEELPRTAWQTSGSRTSEHYFLEVPGLDADIPLDDPQTGENVGHVKAAPQSIIVGPSSRHPDGGHYGPLHDADAGIATISEGELRSLIGPYTDDALRVAVRESIITSLGAATPADREAVHAVATHAVEPYLDHVGPDSPAPDTSDVERAPVDLDIYDVLSSTSYPEGERCEHPFHRSETGKNFMVHEDGDSWRCWRHGGGGYAAHLVGIEQGVVTCREVAQSNGQFDAQTWREIFDAARSAGYNIATPTEAVRRSPDIARCPKCDAALGEHRRDPLDESMFKCGRCRSLISEDDAYQHVEGGVDG